MHIIESSVRLLEVLRSSTPITREKQFIQTVQRYVSVQMFPLLAKGELVEAASIFRDTTEVNRLNMELERAAIIWWRMKPTYNNRRVSSMARAVWRSYPAPSNQ